MLEKELASRIDHTILRATATKAEIITLCAQAKEHSFASVCVNPCYVPLAREQLLGSTVKVCTVVGFPLGACRPQIKAYEAAVAVQEGATEVDMVISIGFVKDKDYAALAAEVKGVVDAVQRENAAAIVKVIIETCLLTDMEKEEVCRTLLDTGAAFVKTSTGFSTGGATTEDVALMRRIVGTQMQVKASGGVRTLADAQAMCAAGADRLGTSNGIQILADL